ncbi:MAG: ATP-binding cassette domain-containing protein [Calditrichaeota bacterium]|nr:ATP-binding cassette domain-containing protein [Calditrichota bacterium]
MAKDIDTVLKIQNLKRSFGGKTVLDIKDLKIPRGKFVVILGNSGCGKTTFLETIGLMSHPTEAEASAEKMEIIFSPGDKSDGKEYPYSELWQNEEEQAHVRQRYFSFLFQHDNLLPDLDVSENVFLSTVIQDGKDELFARKYLIEKLNKVNIDGKLHDRPNQLSGGQRQRVSFSRADFRRFSLLFADEPTGNLDEENARQIFQLLRDKADSNDEINKDQTILVVSHDINLALTFADLIIVIQKDGFLSKDGVFESYIDQSGKRVWKKNAHETISISNEEKIKSLIKERMNTEINGEQEKDGQETHRETIYPDEKSFPLYFNKIVDKDLSHKSFHALVLMGILLIVICAIGFSDGSMKYLEKKMRDPFVTWLDLEIPMENQQKIPVLVDSLLSSSVRETYYVESVNEYSRFALHIWSEKKNGTFISFGRTIQIEDPILKRLENQKFLIKGDIFRNPDDYGLIVSERFLELYGYSYEDVFVTMSVAIPGYGDVNIPVPIRGIVKDLPGKNEFLATPYLHFQRYHSDPNPFHPIHSVTNKELIIFVPEKDGAEQTELRNGRALQMALQKYFDKNTRQYEHFDPWPGEPQKFNEAHRFGSTVATSFLPDTAAISKFSIEALDSIYLNLMDIPEVASLNPIRLYTHPFNENIVIPRHDHLSINIANLDHVAEFKDYLYLRFLMDLDIAKVESLENYNFVANLTGLLSLFMILFSMVTIAVFVYYILYMHLYKMKTYLGTLKAFGVGNQLLLRLYLKKMMKFIGIALTVSTVAAYLVGKSGFLEVIMRLFYTVERGQEVFNLFNWWFLAFIILVCFAGFVSVYYTSKAKILSFSPGDLLYNRIEK